VTLLRFDPQSHQRNIIVPQFLAPPKILHPSREGGWLGGLKRLQRQPGLFAIRALFQEPTGQGVGHQPKAISHMPFPAMLSAVAHKVCQRGRSGANQIGLVVEVLRLPEGKSGKQLSRSHLKEAAVSHRQATPVTPVS
jgi:hypothetical protein